MRKYLVNYTDYFNKDLVKVKQFESKFDALLYIKKLNVKSVALHFLSENEDRIIGAWSNGHNRKSVDKLDNEIVI
ncbi:amino acid adenylation domain-containing protein [Weissella oryzae SG25]|uniref:Amino acid adenylation domain-containing protein n=1 Tax=Weissella oryzae (strain DSM 25784 / JCM 18191 / LMG 30913 / SG25) TaxID=1329250 RepID=A0A069CTW2_WEIOS|nr:amino acid adenylation domain-containing protein [Weissella oryzae SG25]